MVWDEFRVIDRQILGGLNEVVIRNARFAVVGCVFGKSVGAENQP